MAAVNISGNQQILCFSFQGMLDIQTVPALWKKCLLAFKKYFPQQLVIDLAQVEKFDEAGMDFLLSLQRYQSQRGHGSVIQKMPVQSQELYELMSKKPIMPIFPEKKQDPISELGKFTVNLLKELKLNINFLGELCIKLPSILSKPSRIHWGTFLDITKEVGPKALGIVALVGFLLGLILAFQGSIALRVFGAQIYVANLVSLSLFKELAPLMTAIVLIGRSASAFAAELGMMTVNQEVDALKTMGFEPIHFLVLPRLFAGIAMMPVLTLFMSFFGLVGCDVVMASMGFSSHIYIAQIQSALSIAAVLSGLLKAFVFGIIISAIGCLYGLNSEPNASSVGTSTTRAVVVSIVMVAIFDGIFSVIYYVFGI